MTKMMRKQQVSFPSLYIFTCLLRTFSGFIALIESMNEMKEDKTCTFTALMTIVCLFISVCERLIYDNYCKGLAIKLFEYIFLLPYGWMYEL